MEIIKHIDTNVVIYAGAGFSLTDTGLTSALGLNAPTITTGKYVKQSVESVPADFWGNHYSYNGTWTRTQAGIDAENARKSTMKAEKKAEIKAIFKKKMLKPVIDTGLGFNVDGGRDNLQDFQGGLSLGFYFARDAENITHKLTKEQMEQVISKIQENGLALYQRKWELEALIEKDINTDITTGWPSNG